MSTYEVLTIAVLIVTLIAILVSPIAAVLVTRKGDNEREQVRRKSDIFSTLMRTRAVRMSFEHVGALNLIQLEFYGEKAVQDAYSSYMAHLNLAVPKDPAELQRHGEVRSDRFVELLFEIGRSLGYSFDKRDLEKLAYGPVGWGDDESTIRMMRTLSLDIMSGKTPLAVSINAPKNPSGMFPPAPEQTPPS